MLLTSTKYEPAHVTALAARECRDQPATAADAARASVTAIPGWGLVGMGLVALAAAWIAQGQRVPEAWTMTWLIGAVVASHLGIVALWNKARRHGVALLASPWRGKVLGSAAAVLAASGTTVALVRRGQFDLLPAAWLLFYGLAVLAGGAWSVRIVPALGAGFTGLGVVALGASHLGHLLMVIGFGVLQIVCGVVIARKHGG